VAGFWISAANAAEVAHGAANAHGAHGAAQGGMKIDPIHQFQIKPWWEYLGFGHCDGHCAVSTFTFTNSALFMGLAVLLVTSFIVFSMRRASLVPGRMQSLSEVAYEFVAKMVTENAGKAGMQFFPFIFSLFIFILVVNMLGMVPLSFTVTSHIIVTFGLAALVFMVVTITGFVKNGPGFLKLFLPSGAPIVLLPLLIIIEFISYMIRPVSLSVRLFANMLAGHMMLKVFAGFVVGLGVIGGWAPLAFMVALTGLEVLVAFLQAFVFAVLTCIYLNDALHMHH
jgi:F-type H+-transporting ATPase subunit a